MDVETLTWINTMILIVAAMVEISAVFGIVTMLVQMRREAEIHEQRIAAIMNRLR